MNVIVVEHVTKQFSKEARPAVADVSFTAEEGAFVVLLGPSGCGKTTLLKMINRLYEPDSGRILVGGVDARELPVTDLRRRIGYVIQQVGLFPHMRIEQNIAVVPQLLGWTQPRIDARIDELIDLVGLPREYRKRYPRQLSGGEQQRIGLARALAADPSIMLMDEPFGAIDAITRARLQDELLAIQRQLHKTILFVTHDVEEALRLADRIIVMRAGTIVQYDTPLQIITQPRDAFVRDLVGAEDVMRGLSLVRVGTVLEARSPSERAAIDDTTTSERDGAATINADDDLRSALSRLLASGAESLTVVDADGRPLGRLTLEEIRAVAGQQQPAAQAV
ncbi:MAG TPA: ABC transporter ATP-binding protein [Roseiflexaceae bacterium]|nr:ABC transporter ATP-binding protein [Roseiflexaceae bacterium]